MDDCAVCGKEICFHGVLTVINNKPTCNLCGKHKWLGEVFNLPMYEGAVNWDSLVYFAVCDECYEYHIHEGIVNGEI